jgi:hypothetical protein
VLVGERDERAAAASVCPGRHPQGERQGQGREDHDPDVQNSSPEHVLILLK